MIRDLAGTPLFEGLDRGGLEEIGSRMRPRGFARGDVICREGEPGESLMLIRRGLAEVTVASSEGERRVARLRRGDVIGEMSLLTGEPRSATVRAVVPTETLELDRHGFAAAVAHHPVLVVNVGRILSRRLARTNVRPGSGTRGEAVALVTGDGTSRLAEGLVAAARSASVGEIGVLDPTGSFAGPDRVTADTLEDAVAALDGLLADRGLGVILLAPDAEHLNLLLEQADRIVVLGDVPDAEAVAAVLGPTAPPAEMLLVQADSPSPADPPLPVARTIDPTDPDADLAWAGRHLARTKLGLALGAGGAKGFAHVGVLQVLEEAGYTVDYVAGSSIGAMVGAWLAGGQRPTEIEATLRAAFSPENTEALYRRSFSGLATEGVEVMARICRETTDECTFGDLGIPLTVMTVDLDARAPSPLREGLVWEALVAATALPGLVPPYRLGGRRLVDGLALIPVPAAAVREAGADVTVSVNIMNHHRLPAWPGQAPPEPEPARRGPLMLDTLMEVMDLSQLDASVRSAAKADVVVEPAFGPGSWRDFHLGPLMFEAGREAAAARLHQLRALARPT